VTATPSTPATSTPSSGIAAALQKLLDDATKRGADEGYRAAKWGSVHLAVGSSAAVLSAVAAAVGLGDAAGRVPAAVIALVASGLVAVAGFLDSRGRQKEHQALSGGWMGLAAVAEAHLTVDVLDPAWVQGRGREVLEALIQKKCRLLRGEFSPTESPSEAPA